MPALKSQQLWPIDDIAERLVPALRKFLNTVPESRLANGAKSDCLNRLARVVPPNTAISTNASTDSDAAWLALRSARQ